MKTTSTTPPASPPLSPGRTALLGFLVILITGTAQQITMAAISHVRDSAGGGVQADGLALALGILVGALLGGVTLAFIVRRVPRAALGLVTPSTRQVINWLLVEIAVIAAIDLGAHAIHRDLVPRDYIESYRSAGAVPLLILALVVAAPILEEVLFRGFLLGGLSRSRLGMPGAVAVTCLLFTLIHGPTDAWSALTILGSALVLAAARIKTGSTLPGIAMHALGNAKVLVHVALVAGS